jgi:hypothetical protein
MPTLTLPLTNSPAFVLLALGLQQHVDIKWDTESGDLGEPSLDGIKGIKDVRAELEKVMSGKEVRMRSRIQNSFQN